MKKMLVVLNLFINTLLYAQHLGQMYAYVEGRSQNAIGTGIYDDFYLKINTGDLKVLPNQTTYMNRLEFITPYSVPEITSIVATGINQANYTINLLDQSAGGFGIVTHYEIQSSGVPDNICIVVDYGQSASTYQALIRVQYVPGDLYGPSGSNSLDGKVDSPDFIFFRSVFNTTYTLPTLSFVPRADFNGDLMVDSADFIVFRNKFNSQAPVGFPGACQ